MADNEKTSAVDDAVLDYLIWCGAASTAREFLRERFVSHRKLSEPDTLRVMARHTRMRFNVEVIIGVTQQRSSISFRSSAQRRDDALEALWASVDALEQLVDDAHNEPMLFTEDDRDELEGTVVMVEEALEDGVSAGVGALERVVKQVHSVASRVKRNLPQPTLIGIRALGEASDRLERRGIDDERRSSGIAAPEADRGRKHKRRESRKKKKKKGDSEPVAALGRSELAMQFNVAELRAAFQLAQGVGADDEAFDRLVGLNRHHHHHHHQQDHPHFDEVVPGSDHDEDHEIANVAVPMEEEYEHSVRSVASKKKKKARDSSSRRMKNNRGQTAPEWRGVISAAEILSRVRSETPESAATSSSSSSDNNDRKSKNGQREPAVSSKRIGRKRRLIDEQSDAEEVTVEDDYLGGRAPESEDDQGDEEDDEDVGASKSGRVPLFASTRELLKHKMKKQRTIVNVETPVKKKQKKKPFTPAEDKALLQGVRKYGHGQWAVILKVVREKSGNRIFDKRRTGTSLRDRYRTLVNSNSVPQSVLDDAQRADDSGVPNSHVKFFESDPEHLFDWEGSDDDDDDHASSDDEMH